MNELQPAWAHPTAIIEDGVQLGDGTKVWDHVHIRTGARIGTSCIVGEKSYVAYDCIIGSFVKINACVYVCAGVNIEDFCMISAHTVFTNDRFPRAGNSDLTGLETSEPTEETLLTRVRRGVTIGANATIGPGVTLGEFSMIGMGAVVTRDADPHRVVVGNPASPVGWACVCGTPLIKDRDLPAQPVKPVTLSCARCKRLYTVDGERLHVREEQGVLA